ncbi:hypothetical protein HPB47_007373, partial [Ixodes persulcatus]
MGGNAALANEFELPFSDLTPTEREMVFQDGGKNFGSVQFRYGAWTVSSTVDRHCSLENQESCPKRVIVEHGHHRIVLDADLSATVDGDEYSAHQLQLLTKRLPDFELERVGERIHFRSRVHSLVLKLDLRGRVEVE